MRFRERVISKLCICSFRLAHRGCSLEAAAAPMFSQPMGNVLQHGGPGVPKGIVPELGGDLLAPDAPAQQLQRASPVGHLAAALPHGLTQARLPLVVGLQGREKDQALEKVVARSRNLPQRDDRNQTMLFTACFHVLREAPASKVRQSDAEGNASHDSSGIFLLRSASAWFLHVRASLCSAKVLFWVDDFGVELLVLARRLLMKTRVPVTAESFLHCRTLTRLIKLSTRWLSHERAS